MQSFKGTQTLMRIFIGESDKHHHQPLYQALVDLFREEKLAGCTVLRSIMGFGAKAHLHSANILRLSQDLPMVIEVVDRRENIERILPKIDEMVSNGMITLENVEVIRYAPKE